MWKDITLSPKGQITLPKEMREMLDLEPGDSILVTVVEGRLVLTPKNVEFNDLAGFLGRPPNGPVTLDEIDETVGREIGLSAASPLDESKDEAA
jgi:antitoxin PrlF